MLKAMEAKLKEAKESGNEAEYQAARKLNAMMSAFSSIDDYYTSTSMIENVERYEEIYEGEKDAAYKGSSCRLVRVFTSVESFCEDGGIRGR